MEEISDGMLYLYIDTLPGQLDAGPGTQVLYSSRGEQEICINKTFLMAQKNIGKYRLTPYTIPLPTYPLPNPLPM